MGISLSCGKMERMKKKNVHSSQALLAVLRDVVGICETHGFTYWVVGGFAVDAKRGAISREHGDIDVCLLERDLGKAQRAFFQSHFRVTRQGLKYVFYKDQIKIDVFPLFDRGECYERKREWFEAKYPKAMFDAAQVASLNGVQIRIPSNEGLRYYASKSNHKGDKEFVGTLPYSEELYAKISYNEFANYRASTKNMRVEEITF
jgi:hypothetical protein